MEKPVSPSDILQRVLYCIQNVADTRAAKTSSGAQLAIPVLDYGICIQPYGWAPEAQP